MRVLPDLKNKIALITGCGRRTGIGYAIAEKLARYGTHTILSDLATPPDDIDPELQNNAVDLTKRFGVQSLACAIDVTSNESIQLALQVVRERFERIDFLFNNAGAVFGAPSTVHDYDNEAWLRTIDVCLHGVFRMSKAVVPIWMVLTGVFGGPWDPQTADTGKMGKHPNSQ
jgi:NAD(P)-dependent dehydrogenase (short-subunit alcohol dehydrogenase family)